MLHVVEKSKYPSMIIRIHLVFFKMSMFLCKRWLKINSSVIHKKECIHYIRIVKLVHMLQYYFSGGFRVFLRGGGEYP